MKKRLSLFVYTVCLLTISLSATAQHTKTTADWAAGIPQTLAIERAAELSEICYDLLFLVPQSKNQAVTGSVTIRFSCSGDKDVAIDFENGDEQAHMAAIVNEKTRNLAWKNGHILVPKKHLKRGGNVVEIRLFKASDKALNRHEDYLYTLFVPGNAHTAFPCFDQPDLKARFSCKVVCPATWTAISNGAEQTTPRDVGGKAQMFCFETSDLIPTYLFSFTAGKFFSQTAVRDGREIKILYRETDPKKVAQIETVFNQAALSLRWLENYTAIPYPFSKYALVVLPSYQFGGMEHPGCIQLNDRRIFLGANPTPDEELSRLNLIAHETAHMWFGDLVTMKWFNDVWTKEVFANFMADKIAAEQFPTINHELNFLKSHYPAALSTDRTSGTHPIQQPLDNLDNAGLLYGNIIYHKAPVVMKKLEELMGKQTLQRGLQAYLKRYAYANATWDDLIAILDSVAPQAELPTFSHVWVEEKGLPIVQCVTEKDEKNNSWHLATTQTDPFDRKIVWKQQFDIGLIMPNNIENQTITLNKRTHTATLSGNIYVMPNTNGSGYGIFLTDSETIKQTFRHYRRLTPTTRYAVLLTTFENYLHYRLPTDLFFRLMKNALNDEESEEISEPNEQIANTICGYLARAVIDMKTLSARYEGEKELYQLTTTDNHRWKSVRQTLLRSLSQRAISPDIVNEILQIWQSQTDTLLNIRNYTSMAYHLAIMKPAIWQEIIATQRKRLTNPDQQREFDFVSRACNPSVKVQQELFESLLKKENRRTETWATRMLTLLNAETREQQANNYITPALEALEDIQHTTSIFFPSNWLNALLSRHRSQEARQLVRQFIDRHPDYPQTLMNKVKENAHRLLSMPLVNDE